jgi:hypothetical protein
MPICAWLGAGCVFLTGRCSSSPKHVKEPTPDSLFHHFLQFLAVVLVSVLVWTVIQPKF